MTTVLALVFLYFAYTYVKNAMDPSKLSRMTVQGMCVTLGALSLLVSALLFFAGGSGA